MEKHITLDQSEGGHGNASIDWLNLYLDKFNPLSEKVDSAIISTIDFIKKRIKTYKQY